MNIYTKGGDKGTTSLVHTKNLSKSDDRIHLVGTIDELTSHIGLVRTLLSDQESLSLLVKVQERLIRIMAGVADPYNREYRMEEDCTQALEAAIDHLESSFDRPKKFILPGGSRVSAELDITRAVARRAERVMAAVGVKFGADQGAKRYLNRLADYLYMLARYEDAKAAGQETAAGKEGTGSMEQGEKKSPVSEAVIQEVLKRVGHPGRITLEGAKSLIEKIEEEARRRGKQAVIAVCGPDGNPIAVHVMDGAFLVSFDVAVKKAYTSVAVKMSTQELSKLAQPGQTFFGLDKMGDGKIVIFGGGVPLKVGDTIIGGLGVSGGTGEEDHSLAEYGLSMLEKEYGAGL